MYKTGSEVFEATVRGYALLKGLQGKQKGPKCTLIIAIIHRKWPRFTSHENGLT